MFAVLSSSIIRFLRYQRSSSVDFPKKPKENRTVNLYNPLRQQGCILNPVYDSACPVLKQTNKGAELGMVQKRGSQKDKGVGSSSLGAKAIAPGALGV